MAPEPAQPLTFSALILLPDALQKQFERWTDATAGASWPAFGGHVTLLPSFRAELAPEAVAERVAAVCRVHEPFTLQLTKPLAVADRTRQDYFAVFLAAEEDADSGYTEAAALRYDLDQALAPVKHDLLPELASRPFLPHITLALGVSEREAGRVVRAGIESGLIAEFAVEGVTLFAAGDTDDAGVPQQIVVSLGAAAEE